MRVTAYPRPIFAGEAHIDDVAKALNMNPLELRRKIAMPKGYKDEFFKMSTERQFPRLHGRRARKPRISRLVGCRVCKAADGDIRRGVGMALYWYNTGVWPISLESSSCRMVLNQDGSVQVQTGETEIGQGCDTVYAQMTADAVGVPRASTWSRPRTRTTPYGSGAYASRQTHGSHQQDGRILREKILNAAHKRTRLPVSNLDLVEGKLIRHAGRRGAHPRGAGDGGAVLMEDSRHITAEATAQIKSNAYSFGCS